MGSGTGAWRFDPELPGEDSDDPVLAAKACMISSLLDDLWNDMLPAEGVTGEILDLFYARLLKD